MNRAVFGIFACLAIVALLATLGGPARASDLDFGGYTQARYTVGPGQAGDFDLRRVRLKVFGPIDSKEKTEVKFQVDLGKLDEGKRVIELKDAMLWHRFSDRVAARLGFSQMPFGLEVPESSSHRLPLERSHAAHELFPAERDTGLYFYYTPKRERRAHVALGVGTGIDKWRQPDASGVRDSRALAVMVRVQWPQVRGGVAGASYIHATRVRQGTRFENDIWGAHVRYHFSTGLVVKGECFAGRMLGAPVGGWYVQAAWMGHNDVLPYYRYDSYDDGTNPLVYRRHAVGLAYEVSDDTRLTLELDAVRDAQNRRQTTVSVQWQVKY